MANVLIENATMQSIANSIRAKTGKTDTMLPSEMPTEIASIETGIIPSGELAITENGIYNVTNYASANVNVSGGGSSGYQRPADWLDIPTMSGTSDEVYILNGVNVNGLNKIYFKLKLATENTATINWGDGTTETATGTGSDVIYSHEYNYNNLADSSWTTHNNSKQALIHITATRNQLIGFSTAEITYQYTNEDGTTVDYDSNASTDILQISANVESCVVYCSSNSGQIHKILEIFDWKGNTTNTSMTNMFSYCYSLQSIPQLNTSNVTSMTNMFSYCYSLQSIPQLNTSNVTSMQSMFFYCSSLQSIPQLNTSNVTSMTNMFYYCYSLQSIPQLNTSNVTSMQSMFFYCSSLQSIPQLNTSNVTSMTNMFYYCYSLQSIPQLDTSKVTNMSYMFSSCSSLQSIPQLNTSKVTNMGSMFSSCYSLQSIPQLNTSNVTNMSYMFYYCYSLQSIPQLNTSNVTNMSSMFTSCYSLQNPITYNAGASTASSTTISNLSTSKFMTKQQIVDLINSLHTNSEGKTRTLQLGSTLQGYLANTYVKSSGEFCQYKLPTSDTTPQTGKTYYTYDFKTNTYTEYTGTTFDTDTFYYELVISAETRYDICESTETGATLVLTWATNTKLWTIT